MVGRRIRTPGSLGPVLLALGLVSCTPRVAVEDLPTADATLVSVGKRLGRTLSAGELTAIASRGDRILRALTAGERDALARGYLRFRIDRPSGVFVAAPRGSSLFWLNDQGFRPAGLTLTVDGTAWDVHRKAFGTGWVGLGVNGLDRTPSAHYAVFVRATDGREVVVSDPAPESWEALRATEGVGLERGRARPARGLTGPLVGSTLIRQSHDRRHASMLARGRVWKTHVPAGRTPDQVTVAFGAEPTGELVWSWRTAPDVSSSVVRLREPGNLAREIRGGSETIALPDLLNDPVVRRHTVRAAGLRPGTVYEYTVGDGTAGGTSPWSSVPTAPAGSADVHLLYLGDPQCGLEKWGTLLKDAYRRRPDLNAILIAGDLVDRGNERTNWDHFFLRAAGVFGRVPLMPCAGNHEYLDRGPWLYRALMTLPENGPAGVAPDLVYHFEVGDAFVAVLDSTLAVADPGQARLQADWLDAALSRTRRTWKLVMFHHPVYASHPWRESPSLRESWVPVLDRHHVDLVLQGHDHAYLRTYPMRASRRVGSPAEGTVYVVSVSGDKYCDQNPRGVAEVGFTNVSTYQTIDLFARDHRLDYRSFDARGREVDGFSIEKPRGPASVAGR